MHAMPNVCSVSSASPVQFMKPELETAGRQLLVGPATRRAECAEPDGNGMVHWDPTECDIAGESVENCSGARPAAACCREEVCLAPSVGGCAEMDASIECGFAGAPQAACCPAPLEP